MKVIDLLNKIVNGEEVPEKIKWNNTIFILNKDQLDGHFYYEELEGLQQSLVSRLKTMGDLDDEVELIEGDTIDIETIEKIVIRPYKGFVDICNYLEEKGNEIIEAVKQLNRELKELKEG